MVLLYTSFVLSLLATVGSLVFGLFSYFKGGDFNKKWGNKAMRYRVIFQGLSVILFMLILISGK